MISLRNATADDIPLLCEIGRRYHAESSFSYSRYSPFKVSILLARLIQGQGCVIVAEKNGVIVGGIAGVVIESWYSTEKIAHDFCIFLDEEHRRGMLAARIIRRFIKWAGDRGANRIQMGITSGIHVERTAKLYAAMGGRLIGTFYEFDPREG